MKKTIIKLLSVVLSVVMILSATMPAYAAVDMFATKSQIPVIIISGDGNAIYDKNGNELSKLTKFFANNGGEAGNNVDDGEILESIANALLPFLISGLGFDNWEPYYENLQKEISELFGDILLDENGEASNGSGLHQWCYDDIAYRTTYDMKGDKGYYAKDDYQFWYDWRLDPMETAVKLNEYIKGVKRATGAEKVSILCRCLGTNVLFAYLQQFGTADIYGIGFDGSVCMGAEPISESMSGKFNVDGSAIERVLIDATTLGLFDLDSFILASLDLVVKSGALDAIVGVTYDQLYDKLVKGVTSALVLASIVSFPNYWACVSVEDFDASVEYVFGDEGSEKREKYAGLIEKITTYNDEVKKNIPDLLRSLEQKDVKVGIIAKYGFQMIPTCISRNKIGDSFVSLESSSFGAKAGTIYETLSDEYIAGRDAKYISPDKQVDASTCIYPDYTWFVKGVKHSEWTLTEDMLLTTVITADKQLSIDDFDIGQFMVRDNTGAIVTMTEDNCHTEAWDANYEEDHPSTLFEKLWAFLKSLFKWFGEFGKFISSKMGDNA